ncbi:MAG TPA: FxsA family protein [Acidimicrobiales bacterium]|nr:FxsA family protein [Acidimicrobiales bacterium]
MFLLLTVLFLVVPLLELWVIVGAAHTIGVPETIVVLVLISVLGAYLVKWAGLSVLLRMQKTVRQGQVPTREVVDGFLVLLAGALLLVPGFLSDVLALGLLFPPTRAVARRLVLRRYQHRLEAYGLHDGAGVHEPFVAYGFGRATRFGADVVDVDSVDDDVVVDPRRRPPGEPLLELGP